MFADLRVAEAARTQCLHIGRLRHAIIVLDEVRADGRTGPVAVQLAGHVLQHSLVVAGVADQHDMRKARLLETAGGAHEQALEGAVGDRDRPWEAHMLGGRRDISFGHISQHRRDDGIAERRGDLAGQRLDARIVLAQRHVRPILLGAAHWNDDRGRAGLQAIPHFSPGEILKIDAPGRRRGGVAQEQGAKSEQEDRAAHRRHSRQRATISIGFYAIAPRVAMRPDALLKGEDPRAPREAASLPGSSPAAETSRRSPR